jgi:4-amino-4-deoxy-L-arabinose transferase-like glycosyltransferase
MIGDVQGDSPQEPRVSAEPEIAVLEGDAATSSVEEGWLSSRWTRLSVLAVIAILAGLSYAWGISRDPLEPYYAAAVRSMAGSRHDFVYGSFDPAGTITLDKLPGAFWLQALSVRVFGYSAWAMILPQIMEGIGAVLVLYRAVARLAGPLAGLVAAFVLAVSPAVVALDRGDISDSLMILLLVVAADAVSGVIIRDGRRQLRLLLAALCVGLAFQAKMTEAWLLLPALGLAYLVSGPGTLRRRVWEAVVAGLVTAVVSIAWMSAVSLVPAASRPYVDGSQNDSVFAQVFTYNGLGRFDEQTPLQALVNEVISTSGKAPAVVNSVPGADRLLAGALGRDAGWLLPAAAAAAIWGLVSRRRRPRQDPLRACLILWGGWLATLWAAFSALTTINAYYTAALAPAVGAILGTGVALAWRGWRQEPANQAAESRRTGLAVGVAVIVAGTAAYAAWLVPSVGVHVSGWLVPAVVTVGVLSAVIALVALVLGRNAAPDGATSVRSRLGSRRDAVFAAALGTGLVAVALVPAVASAGMAATHESAFDTPFEPAGVAAAFAAQPDEQARVAQQIGRLRKLQGTAPDLMATQTSAIASVFSGPGYEVLPIGGFTGSTPSPTLAQVQADVRDGTFHLVIGLAGTTDPRMVWIAAHCRNFPGHGATRTYYCGTLPGATSVSASAPAPVSSSADTSAGG